MIQYYYNNIFNFINNCSFYLLICSIMFYWFRLFFIKIINIGTIIMSIVNILIFTLLILRWFISQHFPLSNLYHSIFNIATNIKKIIFTSIHLIIEYITKKNNSEKLLFGAILSTTTFFFYLFANFKIPNAMQKISPLIPALKSNWLIMHVTIMLLSYATLICGSLFSIAFLLISINNKITISNKKIKFLLNIDNISYRIISFGFSFLTLGILSGSIWANEAWGSYWSWDPKETWALITWIIYSIYLHARIIKGSLGKQPAWIATGGFIIIWICFLGVNLIGKGLHSYGWII
uniref:Cytochrome c biogenesis protein CcsA n=1 Tax=Dichotomosiphon tuberosus TaxID=118263 RepID=A0A386AWW8_9CHLO|nr:cytochrome c biogenesis protein Ccs1 [Dichotomosiphon tuberosus]